MIISGYDIDLKRLKHEDIEMLRGWRNAEHIRNSMEYREHISPEMQEKWFRSIDNASNNYFIISYKGEKIGVINGSGIDWIKKETLNGGIFIWKEEYWNTLIPLLSSILLTDISFSLGMERSYARVLKSNPKAISFNKLLGYELMPDQEETQNQLYVLTKENYFKKTAKLRKTLEKLSSGKYLIRISNMQQEASSN
ncbi:MAG: GNAT family N-acetyltransferase, partial [Bacteroidota bacterium]|nr:GNAT family N-acetyltransferase [Bacteroidota bacterium]